MLSKSDSFAARAQGPGEELLTLHERRVGEELLADM